MNTSDWTAIIACGITALALFFSLYRWRSETNKETFREALGRIDLKITTLAKDTKEQLEHHADETDKKVTELISRQEKMASDHRQGFDDVHTFIRDFERNVGNDYVRKEEYDRGARVIETAITKIDKAIDKLQEGVDEVNRFLRRVPSGRGGAS